MNALRDGSWLTADRIRAGALILLIGNGAYLAWLFGTSDGMLDSSGRTLGAGFARVWAAGRLALEGRPEAAFDPALYQLYLKDLFGTGADFSHGWRSSPAFLMVAGILAAFPYLTALIGFVLITLSLFLAAIERICEKTGIGLSTLYLVAAAYPAALAKGSKVAKIYGDTQISERHRHRYEVNTKYRARLEKAGVRFCGLSPDGLLPEIIELPDHPWFIGVQFHPELKSRPFEPHPLFASFIGAAVEQSRLV